MTVNYMEQVAKMLGLELGEVFKVEGHKDIYAFYGGELINLSVGSATDMMLAEILKGKETITKLPWKPEKGGEYWRFNCGEPVYTMWENDFVDNMSYAVGNCYRTKEEALADKENLLKRIKKIAENDGRYISWED